MKYDGLQNKENILIRETQSVCSICLSDIPAKIVEREDGIFMVKSCDIHGAEQILLSTHPWYYRGLHNVYFNLNRESYPQRDYLIRLTERCNLDCPICLAMPNVNPIDDYPLKDLLSFFSGKKKCKIDLMSAEPTMREDLPEIIRSFKDAGHIVALHTNGIKIADYNYLLEIKKAGVNEIHVQFDGFDDSAYKVIRGKELLDIKLEAFDNLEKLNIATSIIATIVRGINEKEISRILDFGSKKLFVKEIFFLGCRHLGWAKSMDKDSMLLPEEVIDLVEEQTEGNINRRNVFNFQKIYFLLLSLFSIRKCFYIQHYLIKRNETGYTPIHDILDLESLGKITDRYVRDHQRNGLLAFPRFAVSSITKILNRSGISLAKDMMIMNTLFRKGFDLSKAPRKFILLGFISTCDPLIFDKTIADNCGKGEISMDQGVFSSGACANIARERSVKP